MKIRPAIFLDRDGVINEEVAYLHRVEDFRFVNGAVETLQALTGQGWPIVIVTNQSGIGRGYYSEKDFLALTDWMLKLLADSCVDITAVYWCPHDPEAGCACRKPAPELIFRAAREHQLDLPSSWLVGDQCRDIEAARRAGISNTVLVRSGHPVDESVARAAFVRNSICDIIPLIGNNSAD